MNIGYDYSSLPELSDDVLGNMIWDLNNGMAPCCPFSAGPFIEDEYHVRVELIRRYGVPTGYHETDQKAWERLTELVKIINKEK